MLTGLDQAVRGQVWFPDSSGFERAHRAWNLAVPQAVCAVVEAIDVEDVVALIRFAGSRGLSVATQPSGHGATGRAAGAILLRTSRLDTIEIDPVAMTATIGAGVRSGDLQRATAAHGLTAMPGSSPVVTVAGAALGGGLSWFGRAFGWIADSILSAHVITADGNSRHVNPRTDPELMWAIRGGGGDLVVVTELTLQLRPAPTVFGGRQLWSIEHAHDVAQIYRNLTVTAPDALTLWLEFLHFPSSDPLIAIDSTYLGDETEARDLMAATRTLPAPISDTRNAMTVAELGTITAEPTDPSPGMSRGEVLVGLDDSAFAALLEQPIAPLMTVQIRHLEGALAQPSDSPHGALTEPYAIYMFGSPISRNTSTQIANKQAALAEALPVTGRKPITFLNPSENLSAALPPASVKRLQTLKHRIDPRKTIRGNFSIGE